MSNATASKTDLILSGCTYWMRADARHSLDKYMDKTKANAGTFLHDRIHEYNCGQYVHIPESHPDYASTVRKFGHMVKWLDDVSKPGVTVLSEICYEADLETGQAIMYPAIGHRQYLNRFAGRPCAIMGTADIVVLDATIRCIGVYDWKTGTSGEIGQLKTLALMHALCNQTDAVEVGLLFVNDYGVTNTGPTPLSGVDLAKHRQKLVTALSGISNTPKPGSHCVQCYCPHVMHCSAFANMDSVGDVSIYHRKLPMVEQPVSDSHAGEIMENITVMERRAKYFKEAIKSYVTNGGSVPSTDGKQVWSKTDSGWRWGKVK